jgi:hypothetical protein
MKKILISTIISTLSATSAIYAAESGSVRNCGAENVGNPYLAQATAYCEPGRKTATGSDSQEGIVAGPPEWIGCTAAVYLCNEDGSIGDFLNYYPIEDTGYGHDIPGAQGYKSEILKNKVPGTVETGITLDFRQRSERACKDFMLLTFTGEGTTGSQVWVQIIKGDG